MSTHQVAFPNTLSRKKKQKKEKGKQNIIVRTICAAGVFPLQVQYICPTFDA